MSERVGRPKRTSSRGSDCSNCRRAVTSTVASGYRIWGAASSYVAQVKASRKRVFFNVLQDIEKDLGERGGDRLGEAQR